MELASRKRKLSEGEQKWTMRSVTKEIMMKLLDSIIQPDAESEDENVYSNMWNAFEKDYPPEASTVIESRRRVRKFVCSRLLELFYERHCTDAGVITRLLYAYSSVNPSVFLGNEIGLNSLNENLRSLIPYTQWQQRQSPLTGMIYFAVDELLEFLVHFLVKYGVPLFPPDDFLCLMVHRLVGWGLRFDESDDYDDLYQVYPEEDHILDQLTFSAVLEPGYRRKILTLFFLYLATFYGVGIFDQAREEFDLRFKYFNLMLQTTTEPYITRLDVRKFYARFCEPASENLKLEHILPHLTSLSPETEELYRPRTLRDLCRCKVRKSLKGSETLPAQVSKLPIPKLIKMFILFHNADVRIDFL